MCGYACDVKSGIHVGRPSRGRNAGVATSRSRCGSGRGPLSPPTTSARWSRQPAGDPPDASADDHPVPGSAGRGPASAAAAYGSAATSTRPP